MTTSSAADRLLWRSPTQSDSPHHPERAWTARSGQHSPASTRDNALRADRRRPGRVVRASAHQSRTRSGPRFDRPIKATSHRKDNEEAGKQRPLRSVLVEPGNRRATGHQVDALPTRSGRQPPTDPFGDDATPRRDSAQAVDPFDEDRPAEPAQLTIGPAAVEEPSIPGTEQDRVWSRRATTLLAAQPERSAVVSRQEPRVIPKTCEDALERLRNSSIYDVELDMTVDAEVPEDCYVGNEPFVPRHWPEVTFMWKASALCHKPLYFENVELERYGHSWGPFAQPLVSGAHFFASLPILPYKMGLKTPNECVYSLGYYRPGSCAPYLVPAVPFNWRAAVFQAGGVVAFSAIFP